MVIARVVAVSACLFACSLAAAQGGEGDAPGDADSMLWRAQARIVFELDELLEQGVLPVTVGGMQAPNEPHELRLVELASGKPRWSVPLGAEIASMAGTKTAVILGMDTVVAALSLADGNELWTVPLEGRLDTGGDLTPYFRQIRWFGNRWARSQGIGGALLTVGDRIYLKVGEEAYCLNATTGEVLWHSQVGFSLSAPVTVCGKALVTAIFAKGIGALDLETGKPLWFDEARGIDRVFSIDGKLFCTIDDNLVRVDPETGAALWQATSGRGHDEFVAISGDKVVVIQPVEVLVIGLESGEIRWRADAGHECAALGEGVLYYLPPTSAELVCVDLAQGAEKWRATPWTDRPQMLRFAGDQVLGMCPLWIASAAPNDGAARWQVSPNAGKLFDMDTVCGHEGLVYLRTDARISGLDATGTEAFGVDGQFFFANWMRPHGGRLYLHDPHNGTLAAAQRPGPKAG
jgi:outer membrane protein assembly factor BamB